VVDFDSTILPGREGKITQKINLKGYSGLVSKSMTIMSNDPKNPSIRVTLKVTIQPLVEITPSNFDFSDCTPRRCMSVVTVRTKKDDFSIKSVKFKYQKSGGAPQWQSDLPVYVDHELSKGVKDSSGVYSSYTLTLSASNEGGGKKVFGTFILETNHPKKPEVEIRGSIPGAM
jgi:hypothetical protein